MKLSELIKDIDARAFGSSSSAAARVAGDVEIKGISIDSRRVESGHLFAALPGERMDGRDFVADALARGASAILAPMGSDINADGAVLLEHENPRLALARIAGRFYGNGPENLAAVTGTNGKTSVASFARQIWTRLGLQAASIGTLGVEAPSLGDKVRDTGGLTTPDAVTFQRTLADLQKAGIGYAVFEASSHGLMQYRMDGARLKVAAFTNLSRDHLDYHSDMDSYFAAKKRLFDEILQPNGIAVINTDDFRGRQLADHLRQGRRKLMTVGHDGAADMRIVGLVATVAGSAVHIEYNGESYHIAVPLMGDFQASNALVAAGIVLAAGGDDVNARSVFAAIEGLKGVSGRVELVGQTAAGAKIVVDYAHTPDGLENALRALRPHATGKLHVIFGCGGDRDAGKRAIMGEVACRLADKVYVTDDNPRSENPAAIRAEILVACPGATEFDDRFNAIKAAVAALGAGDLLLVAGKGHEEGQDFGDRVLPFSDLGAVGKVLSAQKTSEVHHG